MEPESERKAVVTLPRETSFDISNGEVQSVTDWTEAEERKTLWK
jgi:hypothetical protein